MKTQYIKINTIGDKFYYSDKKLTKLHREDGPAFEQKNGYKEWYLNGIEYTEQEHAERTKKVPTININGKDFTVEELNSLIERSKEYSCSILI